MDYRKFRTNIIGNGKKYVRKITIIQQKCGNILIK